MTWYFDSSGTTMDVYDHEKTLVAESREFGGLWSGDFPNEVLTVMRESMDGDQPSAYNQALLGDAATENIEQGADPVLSLTIAMIIISGPKLAEWWLVREDYVEYEDLQKEE